MKKLLSIVLALALALSLSVTAFAGDTEISPDPNNEYKPNPESGSTSVSYTVNPAYTVTIPEKVTLGGDAVTVKAEGVKVAKGKQVVVKLTGINVTSDNTAGDNEFKVKTTEGAELKYTVKIGTTDITTAETSNTVLTVNPSSTTSTAVASGSTQLTFALDDTVQYAGDYTGTVTFTVSVEDVNTTTP